MTKISVLDAINKLACVCDGALDEDGSGFNKPDASMYNHIQGFSMLTKQQEVEWLERLQKYTKTQLSGYVIELSPETTSDEEIIKYQEEYRIQQVMKHWTLNRRNVVITFGYNDTLKNRVKEIPGRRFDCFIEFIYIL
jgi:hypothetical protein